MTELGRLCQEAEVSVAMDIFRHLRQSTRTATDCSVPRQSARRSVLHYLLQENAPQPLVQRIRLPLTFVRGVFIIRVESSSCLAVRESKLDVISHHTSLTRDTTPVVLVDSQLVVDDLLVERSTKLGTLPVVLSFVNTLGMPQ